MPPDAVILTSSVAQGAVRRGAVMAFDFGKRRVGVAVGDYEVGIAHPLETIAYRSNAECFALVEELVAEWHPVLFVVGLPINSDGSEHSLSRTVRRFCSALTRKFGVPGRLIDERFTSAEAASILRGAGVHGRKQKAYLDQVAAQTILEDFFSHGDFPA